jgi:hypothetical protein
MLGCEIDLLAGICTRRNCKKNAVNLISAYSSGADELAKVKGRYAEKSKERECEGRATFTLMIEAYKG